MTFNYWYKILKKLKSTHYILIISILFGSYFLLFDSRLPMKIIGFSIVLLSFLGLIITLYQTGYTTGKQDIIEEKRPSAELPKNIKVDIKKIGATTRKTFENVDSTIEKETTTNPMPNKVSPKQKTNLLNWLINFVASEEKNYTNKKTKTAKNGLETIKTEEITTEPDYFDGEGSFKILKREKKNYEPSKEAQKYPESNLPDLEEKQNLPSSDIESTKIKELSNVETKDEDYSQIKKEVKIEIIKPELEEQVEVIRNKKLQFNISEFFDDENLIRGEPIKEMRILFEKLLNVIRTVSKTQTAIFFLLNKNKRELVLQAVVSEKREYLKNQRKYQLGGDLLSQIVDNGKPEIIDLVNSRAELDLIPYYVSPIGIKSFIGVPIVYKGSAIGILCGDSTYQDAYDEYLMNFFIHISKILNFFLESYTEKYELTLESKTFSQINELRKFIWNKNSSFDDMIKNFTTNILNLLDFTTVGLCLYDTFEGIYKVRDIRSRKNFDTHIIGKKVDLSKSIVGKAMKEWKTIVSEIDERKIRVHFNETRLKRGYFVTIPIKANEGVYGAFFSYNEDPTPIPNQYIRIVEDIAFTLGLVLENEDLRLKYRLQEKTKSEYRMISPDLFVQRLDEEVKRANDFKTIFTLGKISIDTYVVDNSLTTPLEIESKKLLLNSLSKVVKEYDVIAELDDGTIGVILIGRNGRETKLMFESIRQKIAQSPVHFNKENYFFTISVGLVQFSSELDANSLIECADKALEISLSKKNIITLY
ncbi:MAG: diguanylate cyclase [Ignavibacteria bacterium]|nr:diguanylate cyclase [Ignavibacteria bacterium]